MSTKPAVSRQSSRFRRTLCAVAVAGGGLLAAVGCSGGYDIDPLPAGELLEGDIACMNDEGSQGQPCSQDCLTASCNGGTGRRVCTCEGGVFLQCACLPPADWPYREVPAAPYCDPLTGQPRYMAGTGCKTEGAQCVSRAFPAQGCTCRTGVWQCGASDGFAADAAECEALGSGLYPVLKDKPCDTLWQLCISRDFNQTGTSPRGCACMMDGGRQAWRCGGTNRWYRAE